MEENKEEKIVDTEELKKETVNTVNQVKETIKKVDIKNDAKEATGFVSAMLKDPFAKIQEIAHDTMNKNFKTALVLIIVWMVAILVRKLALQNWRYTNLFTVSLSLVKSTIAPVIGILVLSLIIYCMNEKAKKSLITIVTAVTIANIPNILATMIQLLTIVSASIAKLTNPIASFGSVITIILTYFSAKALFEEKENSKFLKIFIGIEAIYYVAYLVISFLEIYI